MTFAVSQGRQQLHSSTGH